MNTLNLNALWCSLIVEELVRLGNTFFCISPGSRSSPLTWAIASHPEAQSRIFYDERGAAFFALGYAKATGKSAVLVCTSGTAVANYLPAVVESSASEIPLLILSADRPPELLKAGANQAIEQRGIFSQYLRWAFQMPCPEDSISPAFVVSTVGQAVFRALSPHAGPVQLNCQFREPLAPVPGPVPEGYLEPVEPWLKRQTPWTQHHLSTPVSRSQEYFIQQIRDKRGVLILGEFSSLDAPSYASLKQLTAHLGWPVFADVLSGFGFQKDLPGRVMGFDLLLENPVFCAELKPEVIVHLGGRFVSKSLLQFLGQSSCPYLQVNDRLERENPLHMAIEKWQMKPSDFCLQIADALTGVSQPWADTFGGWEQALQHRLSDVLSQGLSEAGICRSLSQLLTEDDALFVGNSLPIRHFLNYAAASPKDLVFSANRGASGIDGLVSSAMGFCEGHQKRGVVVLGDVSLMHDLNALGQVKDCRQPFTIVVLNNHGGGIFSQLPIAQADPHIFERFFQTPHDYGFKAVARGFGLKWFSPQSLQEFQEAWVQSDHEHRVIEVVTEKSENTLLKTRIISQPFEKASDP